MSEIDCQETKKHVHEFLQQVFSGLAAGALVAGFAQWRHEWRRMLVLGALGIAHRRGGYRDPESQAFIESWPASSNAAASGAKNSRRSPRRERRSAPTSTPTTTGRAAA